jgi:hypothetical protein
MLDRTALARKIAAAILIPDELSSYLARHGLVIVEASKWDAAKTALQVIGSFPITHPTENMDAASMATVAGNALNKMEL